MFDSKTFEAIAKTLSDALPDGLKDLDKEIQNRFKTVLHTTFEKLDLVTREEFDVQAKVLEKTREKVDRLEKTLKKLDEKKKNKTKS